MDRPTPAVRLVLGFSATVDVRLDSVANDLTEALRDVVSRLTPIGTRRGGSAQRDSFGVFPIPNSRVVVVGYAWSRAPQSRPSPFRLGPDTPLSTRFPFCSTSLVRAWSPSVSKTGTVLVDDVLGYDSLREELLADARARAAGLRIEPVGNDLDPDPSRVVPFSQPVSFALISDDGRPGALVFGYAVWRPGDTFAGGRVKTWSFDLDDGEVARLVGMPLVTVTADKPAVRVPQDLLPPAVDEPMLKQEVLDVVYTERPFGWWIVS